MKITGGPVSNSPYSLSTRDTALSSTDCSGRR
ncbi:transcriptional repressor, partial [Klebsiella pneumoniae]|nr:transcriptional repressor [Klebsiella pneumoniae]HBX9351032.1 transcriptional repressor [Klebsiella pneumoniae]